MRSCFCYFICKNEIFWQNPSACLLCCLLFFSWCELFSTFRQSGKQPERQELNTTKQPAIHMDQAGSWALMASLWNLKTPARAREELLWEIRIPAAVQVSLYVFAACYSSILSTPPLQQKAFFSEVIYALSFSSEWRKSLFTCRSWTEF